MKSPYQFRKAVNSDALRLSILYKQVYMETYGKEGVTTEFANFMTEQFSVSKIEKTLELFPDDVLVGTYKGNLVGVAKIEYQKECPTRKILGPELNKLYVLRQFYGTGVGYQLIKAVEKVVKEKGEKELWLWVYINNKRAIKFYERQQYEVIGEAYFHMEKNKYKNKVMLKKL